MQIGPFDVLTTYTPSYTQDVPASLGQLANTPDGRLFRFGLAGAANLSQGKMCQAPAIVANHQNIACSTQAIGDTTITVTLGATAATANQYAGGFIGINAGTGLGQTFRIKSHPAAALSTSLVLTLEDALTIATSSTDSKAVLQLPPYNGAIVFPTTTTGEAIGVPIVAVTAAYYAWFQTGATAAVLNQGTTGVGLGLAPSSSVSGALATVAATTQQVAVASQAGVDGEYRFVTLQLD